LDTDCTDYADFLSVFICEISVPFYEGLNGYSKTMEIHRLRLKMRIFPPDVVFPTPIKTQALTPRQLDRQWLI